MVLIMQGWAVATACLTRNNDDVLQWVADRLCWANGQPVRLSDTYRVVMDGGRVVDVAPLAGETVAC